MLPRWRPYRPGFLKSRDWLRNGDDGVWFGALPSLTKDMYGSKLMPQLYSALLTAWGAGSIIGPQIVAFMKDNYADKAGLHAFIVSDGLLVVLLGYRYKVLETVLNFKFLFISASFMLSGKIFHFVLKWFVINDFRRCSV